MPPIMTKPPIVTPVRCNDASEGACPFVGIRILKRFTSAQLLPPAAPCTRNGADLLTLAGTSRSDAAKMDAGELVQVGQA